MRWEVDGLSFDDYIKVNDITDCRFIKIDIEGGEYTVLPTMVPYLKEHRPTLYLSLHPRFLGPQGRAGLRGKLIRLPPAFINTIKILKCLDLYKFIYDTNGNDISGARFLRTSLVGISSVVVTDREWGRP